MNILILLALLAANLPAQDSLATAIHWKQQPDSTYTYTVDLPKAALQAIDSVAPGFTLRHSPSLSAIPHNAAVAPGAAFADFAHNGHWQGVLAGYRPAAANISLLIGITRSGHGYTAVRIAQVQEYESSDTERDKTAPVERVFTLSPLTINGAFSKKAHLIPWLQYQDEDCKGDGIVIRYTHGAWIHKPSACSYGE